MKWGKILILLIIIVCVSIPLLIRKPLPNQIGAQIKVELSEEARQELIDIIEP